MKQVKIENQIWMGENLNVDRFRNGDPIPQAITKEDWVNAGLNAQPAWCYYDNDPANESIYGKLYNWYAVIDSRGLSPEEWHIPNEDEWGVLVKNLGGNEKAGIILKSSTGWEENGNGTDTAGFSGRPGGGRSESGRFYSIGYAGFWWSSTEGGTIIAGILALNYNSGDAYKDYQKKNAGFSVRCVKD